MLWQDKQKVNFMWLAKHDGAHFSRMYNIAHFRQCMTLRNCQYIFWQRERVVFVLSEIMLQPWMGKLHYQSTLESQKDGDHFHW